MTKSHNDYAVTIYDCILSDASRRWPSLQRSFLRDSTRLRRAVEGRGLGFLTLTLPSWGKVFDKALDSKNYDKRLAPQGVKHSTVLPLLFSGLFGLVFDEVGTLKESPDIEAVFFVRQLLYCFKKYRLDCPVEVTEETLDEFFEIEARLPEPYPNTWDDNVPVWATLTGHPLWGDDTELSLNLFETRASDAFDGPQFDYADLRAFCMRISAGELGYVPDWELFPKHGPGATAEAGRGKSYKYEFHHWPEKLNGRFPYDWFGSGLLDPSYRSVDAHSDSLRVVPEIDSREPAARLIAVPKTQKGPRLICAEPSSHQWIQQGIRRWIEHRVLDSVLLRQSIAFKSQERSRDLALSSSLIGDSGTIDLSSASDRLSARLVHYVFQGNHSLLDALHASRSRLIVQTINPKRDSHVKLRKFAPQGSACTFPIQTIVYTILSVWALIASEGKKSVTLSKSELRRYFSRVQVFGDDLIVPVTSITATKLLLEECGLKVNATKTFHEGNFRESCGMDAFMGYCVTPAYILQSYDASPTGTVTTVEQSNNFHLKGCWVTAQYIVSQIPPQDYKRLLVRSPLVSATERRDETPEGPIVIRSFTGSPENPHLVWDPDIQCYFELGLAVVNTSKKEAMIGEPCLTQYFTECPDPELPWSSGKVGPAKLKKRLSRVYR